MLLQPECPAGAASDVRSRQLQELAHHRMSKPQRHRLLHGFPLAAAMPGLQRVSLNDNSDRQM